MWTDCFDLISFFQMKGLFIFFLLLCMGSTAFLNSFTYFKKRKSACWCKSGNSAISIIAIFLMLLNGRAHSQVSSNSIGALYKSKACSGYRMTPAIKPGLFWLETDTSNKTRLVLATDRHQQ